MLLTVTELRGRAALDIWRAPPYKKALSRKITAAYDDEEAGEALCEAPLLCHHVLRDGASILVVAEQKTSAIFSTCVPASACR
jgi:hypothetical protein